MPSPTPPPGSHTPPHPQALDTFFLLEVPFRSGSEPPARSPRFFVATASTNHPLIHSFPSPHGLQRGKKENKTLPTANFSKPEVISKCKKSPLFAQPHHREVLGCRKSWSTGS